MSEMKRTYREPVPVRREDLARIEASGMPQEIEAALVGFVFSEEELANAFEVVSRYLYDVNPALRGTATLCIGHLARIHRALPISDGRVVDSIVRGLSDANEYVRGQAHCALEDIETFVPEVGETIAAALKGQAV